MTINHFRTEFVECIPNPRKEGVLYISTAFKTAVHSCACGCGNKVVTPLNPARWKFTWDGEDTTISPSVGNWDFPCQSHYLIVAGRVQWSSTWSQRQIAAGKIDDKSARDDYTKSKNVLCEVQPGRLRRIFRRLFTTSS